MVSFRRGYVHIYHTYLTSSKVRSRIRVVTVLNVDVRDDTRKHLLHVLHCSNNFSPPNPAVFDLESNLDKHQFHTEFYIEMRLGRKKQYETVVSISESTQVVSIQCTILTARASSCKSVRAHKHVVKSAVIKPLRLLDLYEGPRDDFQSKTKCSILQISSSDTLF